MKSMPKSVFSRLDKSIQELLLAQGITVTEGGARGKNEELFFSLASDVLAPEDVRTMRNGLDLVESVNKALAEQNINGELQLAYKTVDSAQDFGAVFANIADGFVKDEKGNFVLDDEGNKVTAWRTETTAEVRKRLAVSRGTKKA